MTVAAPSVARSRALRGELPPGAIVFGVTGTDGKTTTATMIDAIVAASGARGARATTIGAWVGDEPVDGDTSRAVFREMLARAGATGVRALAVEATSWALATGFGPRVAADVGVFTNLSPDHLDVHGTMDAYLAAKAELFRHLRPGGVAVLNASDPASAEIARSTPDATRRLAYAARAVDAACSALPLALRALAVRVDRAGTRIDLAPSPLADALGGALALRMIGEVHAENALAAAVAAHGGGFSAEAIARGLESLPGVPGRFEVVSDRPWVVVDYAHTPEALARLLRTVGDVIDADGAGGELTCVFGCGGLRDRAKRPAMGRVAAALADRVVVTSDNPRDEDPAAIAAEIERGFADAPSDRVMSRELLRRTAIERVITAARPEDAVVIAGKGHERTQVHAGYAAPHSDVDIARDALARRSVGPAVPR